MAKVNITSPVGRIVMGSLYNPNTTDADGNPLVTKSGPNAGQPRVNYFFAIAIPKAPGETHWSQTAWGAQIWQVGNAAFPNIAQSPQFAWKIEDGDSQIPNTKGKKPCDSEGFPGNWVLKFSGSFAPKIYQQEGGGYVQNLQPDFVKPGYFVQVAFSVEGNGSAQRPGIYLNHGMVCFSAYGQEISFGPDVASAGFGQSPLPAGATMTPPASGVPLPNIPAVAGTVPPPSVYVPPAAPVPVVPNVGFVQMPPPATAAMVPPAPPAPPAPAPPARQMTALANGVTYEQYIASGWTDVLLVQHGMMLA